MMTETVTVEFEGAVLDCTVEIWGLTTEEWAETSITCDGDIRGVLMAIAANAKWRGYNKLMDAIAHELVDQGILSYPA